MWTLVVNGKVFSVHIEYRDFATVDMNEFPLPDGDVFRLGENMFGHVQFNP